MTITLKHISIFGTDMENPLPQKTIIFNKNDSVIEICKKISKTYENVIGPYSILIFKQGSTRCFYLNNKIQPFFENMTTVQFCYDDSMPINAIPLNQQSEYLMTENDDDKLLICSHCKKNNISIQLDCNHTICNVCLYYGIINDDEINSICLVCNSLLI